MAEVKKASDKANEPSPIPSVSLTEEKDLKANANDTTVQQKGGILNEERTAVEENKAMQENEKSTAEEKVDTEKGEATDCVLALVSTAEEEQDRSYRTNDLDHDCF